MINKISNSNINFQGAHLCRKNYETREVFKRNFYYTVPDKPGLSSMPFPRDKFSAVMKDVDKACDRKNYEIYVKLDKDRSGAEGLSDQLVLEATIHKNPPKKKKANAPKRSEKDRVLIVKGSNIEGVFDLFKTNAVYIMEGLTLQPAGKDDVKAFFKPKGNLNTQA